MIFELDDFMTEYKMSKEHGWEKAKGKLTLILEIYF